MYFGSLKHSNTREPRKPDHTLFVSKTSLNDSVDDFVYMMMKMISSVKEKVLWCLAVFSKNMNKTAIFINNT